MNQTMAGKTVVITGANSGIGEAAAIGLARIGANIVMVCRDQSRGDEARIEVEAAGSGRSCDLRLADLSSQKDIRELANDLLARYPRIDVLINNAGAIFRARETTVDGLERTFALNHLSYYMLTNLLLERLKKSAPARIVNVASGAHRTASLDLDDPQMEKWFSSRKAYANSKLANILFTYELAAKLSGAGVVVNAMHPGVVRTNFGASGAAVLRMLVTLAGPIMRTPEKGADTVIWLASDPDAGTFNGKYFMDRTETRSSDESYDKARARRLWEVSRKLTGVG